MKLSHKIFYTSGQLGMMLSARFFFQWIISFAPSALFSAAGLGALIFFFRVYDAVTDPIAGYLSDRLKNTPRITLMNYSIPFFALGLVLCFYPDSSMQSKWLIEFLGMFLFFTGYTFYCIPYWALVGDYAEIQPELGRTLSNLLGLGLLLATALGFMITPIWVTNYGFANSAIITAIISTALMALPNLCDEVERLKPKYEENLGHFKQIFASLFQTYRQKKFLVTCILFVGSQMSLTIMTAAAPFLATKILGGKNSDVAFLMGPMLLVAMPSFFLSQKLSKTWGWQKSVLYASALLAILYCMTSMIGISIIGSPLITAALMFSLSGVPIAILLGLEAEAVAACAKQSNKISTHFGAINFLIKTFNGLALMITGLITDSYPLKLLPVVAGCCLFTCLILAIAIQARKTSAVITS